MSYCEKHEMSNCAECNGAAKRFDASLSQEPLQAFEGDVLPVVPGATVIRAHFPGGCDGCGRRWMAGAIIFRPYNNELGWQGYECCARV